jgi:chromosome segregation ATPase
MTALMECLNRLASRRLGTVVHLGAGSGAVLESYAGIDRQRLILVEGDPDAQIELEAQSQGLPGVELWPRVVRPQSGPAIWHRFSWSALNGPLDAMPLRTVYPRLQRLGEQSLPATGLAELLRALALEPDAERPDLLVLDLPGQEAALLRSLPRAELRRFAVVVLRGCRQPIGSEGEPLDDAVALLRDAGFRVTPPPDAVEAADAADLWPVVQLEFDAAAQQLVDLQAQVAAQAAALEQAQARTQHEASQRQDLEARLAQLQHDQALLQDALGARQRQLDAQQEQTRQEAAQRQDLEARLAQLQRDQALLQAALDARQRQLDAQQQQAIQAEQAWAEQVDQLEGQLRDSADRITLLESARQTAEATAAEVRLAAQQAADERAEASRQRELTLQQRCDEAQRAADQWPIAQARVASLEVEQEQLRQQLLALTADREALILAHESRVQTLTQDLERSHSERDQASQQLDAGQGERAALGAQLGELEARCAVLDSERQALLQELEATRAQREDARHWLTKNEEWGKSLQAKLDALAPQAAQAQALLASTLTQAEQAEQALQAARTELMQANTRIQDLEALLAESSQREQDSGIQLAQSQSRLQALESQAAQSSQREQDSQALLETLRKERNHEAHWHAEHKKWALSLKAERDQLEASLTQASTAAQALQDRCDHEAFWHAEFRRMAREQQALVHAREAQRQALEAALAQSREQTRVAEAATQAMQAALADRDARQHRLDAEILRAEAQLDLIKDVLIREKNF